MIVEIFGVAAVLSMAIAYALEERGPGYVLAFATGCAGAAIYAWLIESWPFFFVESLWCGLALHRWRRAVRRRAGSG